MSTAWYKADTAPRLLRSFPRKKRNGIRGGEKIIVTSVEVWNTTCIVTKFGKSQQETSNCSVAVLVNPSNPDLLGVRKFPYFPRGGPLPKRLPGKYEHHLMGYVRQWGGMEVKKGMLFPFNVVDGLVHELGGWQLALHCFMLPSVNENGEKCPVGKAVLTPPGGRELQSEYDSIVHTVSPFYEHHDGGCSPEKALEESYQNSLKLCEESAAAVVGDREDVFLQEHQGTTDDRVIRFAFPLLGAGGRGFPIEKAIDIAASQSIQWRNGVFNSTSTSTSRSHRDDREDDHTIHSSSTISQPSRVLAFGIPNMENAQKLADAISKYSD
jgi:O-acetyl-ADP-ribose deacetylase (regulator of RNase III)